MTAKSDAPNRSASGFEGEVSGLGLTDIIQMNARNGFSGAIRVQNGQLSGSVFFRDGEVVHAEQGDFTGEDAFVEIVTWQSGRFWVEPNLVTALRTITKRCEHLLLDAHRIFDERRAHGTPAAPAPPTPAAEAPRRPGIESAVDLAKGVPGVTNAVLLTRTGARVGVQGYEGEVLAGQALFVGLVAGELGAAFDAGELRAALVEGSRRHLLLFNSKSHSLGVHARPDADSGAVDAALRTALARGK